MTRCTHQVAAFASALGALVLAQSITFSPPPGSELSPLAELANRLLGLSTAGAQVSWLAAIIYVLVAILGGIAPDIDRSDDLWARILSATILGGHRHLSHSLLGTGIAAALMYVALIPLAPLLTFPTGLLWLGFVAGYASHLAVDGLTHEGVPLLFPWRVYLGLPPFAALRIHTGGWAEQFIVLPGLLILIAWLGFSQGRLLTSLWS